MWGVAGTRGQPSPVTLGDRARDRGDWSAAAEHYRQALRRNPDNPPIWVQYGHAMKESGRRLEAEAAYRRAIESDPGFADAHLQLGHVLKLEGRHEAAKAAYLRAAALDPALADARSELARFGVDDGLVAAARAALPPRPAGRHRPSRITLADRARELGQWAEAGRLYREALARNPGNAPIWVQYGHMLRQQGDLPAAENAYRRAIACDPKGADNQLQLAHALRLLGKIEEARAAYLHAFMLEPSLRGPLTELGELGWSDAELAELRRMGARDGGSSADTLGSATEAVRPDRSLSLRHHPDRGESLAGPFEHPQGRETVRPPNEGGAGYSRSIGQLPGIAPRAGAWSPLHAADIRCLKAPPRGAEITEREIALFVTHSPDGELRPHVLHYLRSLRRQRIGVVLIIAADGTLAASQELLPEVDALFVRKNMGYDFAAWAHVLRLHPDLFDAEILYLLNDSVFGPTNDEAFAGLLTRVRDGAADVVGLTENYERGWHISSYFVALKPNALHSAALQEFMDAIVCYENKEDVIDRFEVRLAPALRAAGLDCAALFPAQDIHNSVVFYWKQLLHSGFPFLKAMIFRDGPRPNVDVSDWREVLEAEGYDVSLAERTLAILQPSPLAPVLRPTILQSDTRPSDDESPKVFLDQPELVGGKAAKVVRYVLEISGWGLARDGVATIDVALDGQHFANARYGIEREDVGRAFPDWEDSRFSGFAVTLQPGLTTGEHRVRVELTSRNGYRKAIEFEISFVNDPLPVERLPRKIPRAEIELLENMVSGLRWSPFFGILLADAGFDAEGFDATLQSLRDQDYQHWHLVIACAEVTDRDRLTALLSSKFEDLKSRVSFIAEDTTADFVGAFTTAARGRRPDLIGVLRAGDILASDALLQVVLASGMQRDADFLYGDERRPSPITAKIEAFLKPQWSPDLLLSTNYIGRFWCARVELLERVTAQWSDWQRFGEYDLVLRCTEAAASIHHVPNILCERASGQIDSRAREREALKRALERRNISAVIEEGCAPGYYRIRRKHNGGRVSVVIATRGTGGLVKTCIDTLRRVTAHRDIEIIIADNVPSSDAATKAWLRSRADAVVEIGPPFNWSRYNNLAARLATGDFLLFLNDDIEIIEPNWLDALLQHAERPEVGIVGPRLLYPDSRVQHGGMFWASGAPSGRHAFRFSAADDPGYFGLSLTTRNVSMVTGACMLMRRDWFAAIGGFDEAHTIVNNDVDLCLRCRGDARLVVYEPSATLFHHEAVSRAGLSDEYDRSAFWDKWGDLLNDGDPYYHKNLSRDRDGYEMEQEPVRLHCAGRPLFRVDDIRRILVVKLDHIGDFITALPALTRLQRSFPTAEFYLLAPPATAALESVTPIFKEVIKFEFFHTRSGHGRRVLSEENLDALQRRLAPYRFDLAVDLRRYLETREVLLHTGARWLAGYDYHNRYPWLDITLESERDERLVRKRTQVGDELCRLVDAIAAAAETNRNVLLRPDVAASSTAERSGRPLVCIHPGVGDDTRQWPTEHFAGLIDLLAENHQELDIALIGGADETQIAEQVLAKVKHKERARSVVGTIPLAELPAFLASAALFVGNNSGPNHIAAGIGIPSVGIYSGVVDAREWAANGPAAIAVQRSMSCSPCYIGKVSDCPRGMACVTELYPMAVYNACQRALLVSSKR